MYWVDYLLMNYLLYYLYLWLVLLLSTSNVIECTWPSLKLIYLQKQHIILELFVIFITHFLTVISPCDYRTLDNSCYAITVKYDRKQFGTAADSRLSTILLSNGQQYIQAGNQNERRLKGIVSINFCIWLKVDRLYKVILLDADNLCSIDIPSHVI